MMAVLVGDVALVFDVPTLTTKLALTQEVTKSRIMVLTPIPFAKCFATCGFLPPWIFKGIHSFKSDSMREVCTTAEATTNVSIDYVGDAKGGVCIC
jgi:hypothetical protein